MKVEFDAAFEESILFNIRAPLVKGEKVCEELHLRIPHCRRFKDSSMRISIIGDLTLSLVRNGMYSQEKLVSVCKSAKLRIFKSRGEG